MVPRKRLHGCGGRPHGTTQKAGYSVSEGRPVSTTQKAGYNVSHSGGRPVGTSIKVGYSASPRRVKLGCVPFDDSIHLPTEWDQSPQFINVNGDLLSVCKRRIAQQRTYDKKPLGIAVCYKCGHM